MNVLDLFSGIGGFSLGLEKAGMKTLAFAESDPYCQRVLAKHWPGVPIFNDVKDVHAGSIDNVEVICGGFPCQDVSFAGLGAGLAGVRSSLWFEFARIIQEFQPAYAIIENVAALRSRGLDTVLGCLASIGYDAEWHCIPAAAVGAPHRRDRVWIIAFPNTSSDGRPERRSIGDSFHSVARGIGSSEPIRVHPALRCPDGPRLAFGQSEPGDDGTEQPPLVRTDWWVTEPDVGRVANGVRNRVDRLRCLGNSIIPQIAELIGKAIMEAHHADIRH